MTTKTCLLVSIGLLSFSLAQGQTPIGIIDVFGNRTITAAMVYQALSVKPGDTLYRKTFNKEGEAARLKQALGVPHVTIEHVCCTEDKKEILFVGIGETAESQLLFRKAPTQSLQLPSEMTASYDSLMNYIMEAVMSGEGNEDYSQGHSLVTHPKSRALQEKFIHYAADPAPLRKVLREAADAKQRAVAAHIIAYAPDKRAVTDDLLYAVSDPDDDVRNNATRALGIFVQYGQAHPELGMKIPAQPFIQMLNSTSWTDRNKGAAVLFNLSANRDPQLFSQLKQEALPALIEMAQWKNKDHAGFSYIILGRMAGLEDEKLFTALYSENAATVLKEMLTTINAKK